MCKHNIIQIIIHGGNKTISVVVVLLPAATHAPYRTVANNIKMADRMYYISIPPLLSDIM
jgi:hypothetical protein